MKVDSGSARRPIERQPAGLLDIHQAADFLNLSEVSIRRYTNSGALAYQRVDGRDEWRFKLEDLERFISAKVQEAQLSPNARNAVDRSAHGGTGFMRLDGMEVPWGSHLCQVYETDRGRVQMSMPFLADGLKEDDACFLVASEPTRSVMLEALGDVYDRVPEAIEAGSLKLLECLSDGPDMLVALDRALSEALDKGHKRMRLVGDMAWFRDMRMTSEELIEFETRFDMHIGHSYPLVSLCLYDARKFSGVELVHALRSHADTFELPLSRFLLR